MIKKLTNDDTILIIIGITVLLFKLFISLNTYGTNDMLYWEVFMENIVKNNSTVKIYNDIWFYNHPPMISFYLLFISKLLKIYPNHFAYLVRLPVIFSDVCSALVLYRIFMKYFDEKRAFYSVLVFILSPILVQVSGFHGNTDPVFMFLILLSIERLLIGKQVILSGFIWGLSINIKLVPILCFPIFFFWLCNWNLRYKFFLSAAVIFFAGFGYHLLNNFYAVKRNIFGWSGVKGIWGITKFFLPYQSWGKIILLAIIFLIMFLISKQLNKNINENEKTLWFLKGIGTTFLIFFVFTPGFGVQYLAWFVSVSLFLNIYCSIVYNIIGGIFLFMVYTYWSKGFPWYFANSHIGQWKGLAYHIDTILWCFLILWLCYLLFIEKLTSKNTKLLDIKHG